MNHCKLINVELTLNYIYVNCTLVELVQFLRFPQITKNLITANIKQIFTDVKLASQNLDNELNAKPTLDPYL